MMHHVSISHAQPNKFPGTREYWDPNPISARRFLAAAIWPLPWLGPEPADSDYKAEKFHCMFSCFNIITKTVRASMCIMHC